MPIVSNQELPSNVRQGRLECIMAPDKEDISTCIDESIVFNTGTISDATGGSRSSRGSSGSAKKCVRRSSSSSNSSSRRSSCASRVSSGRRSSSSKVSVGRGGRSGESSRRKSNRSVTSIESGRTMWEMDGLQLMSDDIARLLGLDVRPPSEIYDDEAFARFLPVVSSADLAALRNREPKNSGAKLASPSSGVALDTNTSDNTTVSSSIIAVRTTNTPVGKETPHTNNDINTGGGPKKKTRRK